MKARLIDWVGVDPVHMLPKRYVDRWQTQDGVSLGSLCDVASGLYVDEYVARGATTAPYLRVNNVREFAPNLSPDDLVHVVPDVAWGDRVRVQAGDVVIARTGTLGRAFVVPRFLAGAVMSQHVSRLRLAEPDLVQAQLIATWLNSPAGKSEVDALASGSTRLELTHEDIVGLSLPRFEPCPEDVRHAAVGALEDFETTLRSSEVAIEACSRLAFGETDAGTELHYWGSPSAESLVESLSPRFHHPSTAAAEARLCERFACSRLGEMALIKRGAGSLAAEYESDGIPYIRTSSIVNHAIELFPEHYGSEATYRAHRQNVGPGDVLLTIEGKIGMVALLADGERCLIKNHIEFIRLHHSASVDPEFLFAFLSSPLGQQQIARRTVVQATIPGLGSESRSLVIPVFGRTKDAQRLLDDVVRDVRKEVGRASAARCRLRERLKTLVEWVATA